VNAARGLAKPHGERLPKCGTGQVSRELASELTAELREVLEPLLKEIESLNERIKEYDVRMEKIAKESYPHVELLKQVKGVGTQIALTYVLTIDDPHRFPKSREVGCFLGLRPGRRDSGQSQPQMHISKEGDRYLRTMPCTERKSLKQECGWKDGDRGGPARTEGINRKGKQKKEKNTLDSYRPSHGRHYKGTPLSRHFSMEPLSSDLTTPVWSEQNAGIPVINGRAVS
jgi:transposase